MSLFSILSLIVSAGLARANYTPEFLIDGQTQREMIAGQKTNWSLSYTDNKSGKKHHHFMKMHDKLMHMIVVSDDLEKFSHIHPTFKHMSRQFEIQVNSDSISDPDNKDVVGTVPEAGRYFVFTESMPHDEEMLMLYSRFEIQSKAPLLSPKRARLPLAQNTQTQYFTEDGKLSLYGATYRVRFEYELNQWCSWWLPKFYVLVETWDTDSQEYKTVQGLQEWLGMGGHAVVISRKEVLDQVSFYHLHALLPVVAPGEFVFPYHDHNKAMDDGNYRMFIQFKHQDKVRTLFFDFIYVNPPLPTIISKFMLC